MPPPPPSAPSPLRHRTCLVFASFALGPRYFSLCLFVCLFVAPLRTSFLSESCVALSSFCVERCSFSAFPFYFAFRARLVRRFTTRTNENSEATNASRRMPRQLPLQSARKVRRRDCTFSYAAVAFVRGVRSTRSVLLYNSHRQRRKANASVFNAFGTIISFHAQSKRFQPQHDVLLAVDDLHALHTVQAVAAGVSSQHFALVRKL